MPRPKSDPSPPPIRRAGRGARFALLHAVLLGAVFVGAALLGVPGRGLEAGGIEAAPGSTFDRARKAAAGKDAAAALPLYFAALRETDEYAVKYAIRDEILALPPVAAEPLSERERATVAARIAEERERDVEKKAEGFEGKGKVKAAYLLRDRLRTLEGITTEKAEQIQATLERMQHAICDEATDDEKAQAKALEGDPKDVEGAFKRAERAAVEGHGRVALRVYKAIGYSGLASQELKDKAKAAVDALRAAMVVEMVPSEKADAELVWEDPHWKGLATSVSHQFVFIGAKDFVETITPADRIRVDLACQLLGDLLGRDLAAGERLTIYYKERFDFGGGLGGGKRIDIGNKAIAKPIAGGLHYHEMSHCAFDVGMIYPGFVEGIANFGATFVLDALGRTAEADDAIRSNRQGWQDDYLDRRMRYFRIQSYAPSCGFLFLPITAKDAVARQAEWAKYRTFFRRLRRELPQEPRDAERIRYFAWVWGDVFGWRLLDEAASARFPVVPQDQERVREEIAKWYELTARGERDAQQGFVGASIEPLEAVLKGCPAGELHDRAELRDGPGEGRPRGDGRAGRALPRARRRARLEALPALLRAGRVAAATPCTSPSGASTSPRPTRTPRRPRDGWTRRSPPTAASTCSSTASGTPTTRRRTRSPTSRSPPTSPRRRACSGSTTPARPGSTGSSSRSGTMRRSGSATTTRCRSRSRRGATGCC